VQRDRAYRRWQRRRIIRNKLGLLKRLGGKDYVQAKTRGKPGRLAKGKIHCSCSLCRTKSYDQISLQTAKQDDSAVQQLLEYQSVVGIDAKLIVVGITATDFSIADLSDAGMLDVVGFDSAAPQIVGDFVRQ